MFSRLSISKQGLIGICLLLTCEFIFVVLLVMCLWTVKGFLLGETHAQEVVSRLNNVANISQKIGIAMIRSASPPELLQFVETSTDYHSFKGDLDKEIRELKNLIKNEPEAVKALEEMDAAMQKTCAYYDSQQSQFRRSPEAFKAFTTTMFALSADCTRLSKRLIKHYKSIEQSKPIETERSLTNVYTLLIAGSIFNLVGALCIGGFLAKRITGRLSILSDNIALFADGEALNKRLLDNDEIGKIDRLFHEMTETLTQARRNERALIANASDVICQLDHQGIFTSVSPSVKAQWGYEPERVLGSHFSTVIKPRHLEKTTQEIERLMTAESTGNFETHVETADGQSIDTIWSVHWSPSTESLFCFVHNITQRKNMEAVLSAQEEQLRTAIENIPLGIVMIDNRGFVKSVNATTEKMSHRKRQDLASRPILSLMEPTDLREEDLLKTLISSDSSQTIRCLLKRPDGNLAIEVTCAHFPATGLSDLLLVLDDISERVTLESIKEDFVNLLGRNLRDPLNTTRKRVTELIDTDSADKKKQERLVRVSTNIERLLKLIDELLSIQKLGAGRLVGSLTPAPVHNILKEAVDAVADHAEQQGISLVWEKADCTVLADADRLVQVIINLLGNAIKFSPRQSEVKLSVDESEDQIEISITDSGRGVPEEMRKAIFEQYVQTSVADGQRGKGTGLGLSICKSIVEAHNGSIGVESDGGHGSRFWFTVPKI
ncbi:MAG: PAS domain-containing sensor histidine kinase [Candidatus Melainabacteria bacterium]|nr:PAS domain-containing sensor histidine kinase [Candidatus Melainabacteria bacterium]